MDNSHNSIYSLIKVDDPVTPFYMAQDCCRMTGGGTHVGARSFIYIKRSVPFMEGLPVYLVTPYHLGVLPRMNFEFIKPEYESSFVCAGIVEGYLSLMFVPEGRDMLYTAHPLY